MYPSSSTSKPLQGLSPNAHPQARTRTSRSREWQERYTRAPAGRTPTAHGRHGGRVSTKNRRLANVVEAGLKIRRFACFHYSRWASAQLDLAQRSAGPRVMFVTGLGSKMRGS